MRRNLSYGAESTPPLVIKSTIYTKSYIHKVFITQLHNCVMTLLTLLAFAFGCGSGVACPLLCAQLAFLKPGRQPELAIQNPLAG